MTARVRRRQISVFSRLILLRLSQDHARPPRPAWPPTGAGKSMGKTRGTAEQQGKDVWRVHQRVARMRWRLTGGTRARLEEPGKGKGHARRCSRKDLQYSLRRPRAKKHEGETGQLLVGSGWGARDDDADTEYCMRELLYGVRGTPSLAGRACNRPCTSYHYHHAPRVIRSWMPLA